jgi:hypothetical protein
MWKERGMTKVRESSVRARLHDLLETFPNQWFSIQDLVDEYSTRFGPVKVDTLRRAVFRELNEPACVMFVRYRSSWQTSGIEVCWAYENEDLSAGVEAV